MSDDGNPRLGRLEQMIATKAIAKLREDVRAAADELKALMSLEAATAGLPQEVDALAERIIEASRDDAIEKALGEFVATVTQARKPF